MTAVQLGDLTFFQAVLQAKNVPLALLLLHAYWPKLDLTKRIQPTFDSTQPTFGLSPQGSPHRRADVAAQFDEHALPHP